MGEKQRTSLQHVVQISFLIAIFLSDWCTAQQTASPPLANLERSLAERRQQIQSHPDDPQRALWLADLGNELFLENLPHDATGITALFGSPSTDQRQKAAAIARELYETATEAEKLIPNAIVQVESAPNFAHDPALQDRRRDLIDTQRDRRIPFLRGVGAFLHAEWNITDTKEKQSLYTTADRLLTPLIDKLESAAAIEARLYAGLAKARLGQFDSAESLFTAVATNPASAPQQIFTARMGGVLNRIVRGGQNGPSSGLDALSSIDTRYAGKDSQDLFFRVLIADQRFSLKHQLLIAAPQEKRPPLIASAIAAYTDLLKIDSATPRETIRAIVLDRLANALLRNNVIAPEWNSSLPGIATVAVADRLAQSDSTREQAITTLESALQNRNLDAEAQPIALFTLGRALFDHGDSLHAAQRFIELAVNFPSDPQAQRAIELGVTIAADLDRASADDSEARTLLREGLSILLQQSPNLTSINHWRFAAGKLALDESRFDEATTYLTQITLDAALRLDANFMLAAVARARAAAATDPAARKSLSQQTLTAIDRVQPLIDAWLNDNSSTADEPRIRALHQYQSLLQIYRAESLLNLNQPQQSLSLLQSIMSDSSAGPSVIAEALKIRIAAHQAMNKPEDALREIEQFMRNKTTTVDQANAVLLPLLTSLERDVQSLIESDRADQATELATRTLLPAAILLEQWQPDHNQTQSRQIRIANAYRYAARFTDAKSRYELILKSHPDSAPALLGKAECLYNITGEENLASAMNLFKRLAAAGPETDSTAYWLSQLRMLQIIDRVDRNTQQILPRIERLKQQDPTLGGKQFLRAFESLRRKYSRAQ